MTHQHESWNVSMKSSTAACLTEFTISPKEENALKRRSWKGRGIVEIEGGGGNCQTYSTYNLTVLPLKLYFTMSRCGMHMVWVWFAYVYSFWIKQANMDGEKRESVITVWTPYTQICIHT